MSSSTAGAMTDGHFVGKSLGMFLRANPADSIEVSTDGWSPFRSWLNSWIGSKWVDGVVAAATGINLCIVILQTDMRAAGDEDIPLWMQAAVLSTLMFYVLEACCRFYVLRCQIWHQPFYVLDFGVSLLDMCLMLLVNVIEFIPMLSLLRFWRIVRFIAILQKMTLFHELHLMVDGLQAALRSLIWAGIFIACTLLFFAVFAVQIIHPLNTEIAKLGVYDRDCERCPDAYSSVWHSSLTFVQQIIAGDSWGQVTLRIIDAYPFSAFFFFPVFLVINLALMNLVLMVIVDQAAQARQRRLDSDKNRTMRRAKRQLHKICEKMDEDKSGNLTLQELTHGAINNDEFVHILTTMEFDTTDLEALFAILDKDSSGTIEYGEFCDQLYRMRTDDSHNMLVLMKHQLEHVVLDMQKELKLHNREIDLLLEERTLLQHDFVNRFNEQDRLLNLLVMLLSEKKTNPSGNEILSSSGVLEGKGTRILPEIPVSSASAGRTNKGILSSDKKPDLLGHEVMSSPAVVDGTVTPCFPEKPSLIASTGHGNDELLPSQLRDASSIAAELSQITEWVHRTLTPLLQEELLPVLKDVKLRLGAPRFDAGTEDGGKLDSSWGGASLHRNVAQWPCGSCRNPSKIRVSAISADDASGLQDMGKTKILREEDLNIA